MRQLPGAERRESARAVAKASPLAERGLLCHLDEPTGRAVSGEIVDKTIVHETTGKVRTQGESELDRGVSRAPSPAAWELLRANLRCLKCKVGECRCRDESMGQQTTDGRDERAMPETMAAIQAGRDLLRRVRGPWAETTEEMGDKARALHDRGCYVH